MGILRERISSPLEAGPSVLDVQQLPPHVADALEYTSRRLARKALHVTLVVVLREYQLPAVVPPTCVSPDLVRSAAASPTQQSSARLAFAASSPVAALRQLVRTGTGSQQPQPQPQPQVSPLSPLSYHPVERDLASPRPRWPLSPAHPMSPPPPMTPSTTASSVVTDSSAAPQSPNPFGIRLIYANNLTAKEEKTLRQTIEKAEKKFRIGSGWLPPAVNPSACGLTGSIIRRSIVQNEILFSSEGLTILSLDRLYAFKAALSSYSRSGSAPRLEDAVDELRRLVLSRAPGRLIPKADVMRSYEWLGVSDGALSDVERMYRRAYGGPEGSGAIDGVRLEVVSEFEVDDDDEEPEYEGDDEGEEMEDDDDEEDLDKMINRAMLSFRLATPRTAPSPPAPAPAPSSSPRAPVLKLQTNFDAPISVIIEEPDENDARDGASDGDLTARPTDSPPSLPAAAGWGAGGAASIDQVLRSGVEEGRGPRELGPMTPNGYEDISPITRGEWGFLMVQPDGWGGGRRVAVETW